MPAGLEADEFLARRRDAVRARHIGKGHHAVGVADIEGVAQQRHAERLAQSFHENLADFGDAVAVLVAQQRDAVGADAQRVGTPHRRLHRIAEHAADRAGDLRRLGNEDVAIGQHVDPARMVETGRKRIDLEPRCCHRNLRAGPSLGGRHLERRDGALRLRHRYHRRAAPGRLRCCALQPPPQQRGAADQRHDARENSGHGHVLLLSAPCCPSASCLNSGPPRRPVSGYHTMRVVEAMRARSRLRKARSVQPQLGDVLRIGLELAALDALDDVGQHRIGAAGACRPSRPRARSGR